MRRKADSSFILESMKFSFSIWNSSLLRHSAKWFLCSLFSIVWEDSFIKNGLILLNISCLVGGFFKRKNLKTSQRKFLNFARKGVRGIFHLWAIFTDFYSWKICKKLSMDVHRQCLLLRPVSWHRQCLLFQNGQ